MEVPRPAYENFKAAVFVGHSGCWPGNKKNSNRKSRCWFFHPLRIQFLKSAEVLDAIHHSRTLIK